MKIGKNKFTNKMKLLFLASSALIVNTSVATLLTSCRNDSNSYIDADDIKYDISKATFKRMMNDLSDQYIGNLDEKKHNGVITDDEYNTVKRDFSVQLSSINTTLCSSTNNMDWTTRTEVLRNYSKKNFQVILDRSSTAVTIADFYETLYSYLSSLSEYLEQLGYDTEQADLLKNETEAAGKTQIKIIESIPPYEVDLITELRQFNIDIIVNSLSDINRKVAEYKASAQLKLFFENFDLFAKKDGSTWDKLEPDPFFSSKGYDISRYINSFLYIHDKNTGEYIEYSKNIIPGYILTPFMNEMTSSPCENLYNINVDWKISLPDTNDVFLDECNSLKDEDEPEYETSVNQTYELPVSLQFEAKKMKEIYLNNIDFKWDNLDKCAKEVFLTLDEVQDVNLNDQQLGKAGLKLNETRLDTLLPIDEDDIDSLKKNAKLHAEGDEEVPIEQQFVDNCKVFSPSQVFYDDSNKITSDFIVGFRHSYALSDDDDWNKNHTLHANDNPVDCVGMEVSDEFYQAAVADYNTELTTMSSYAMSLDSKKTLLDTQTIMGCVLTCVDCITVAMIAYSLLKYASSFFTNVIAMVTAIVLAVQLASMIAITVLQGILTKNMDDIYQNTNKFANKAKLTQDFIKAYPNITPNVDMKTEEISEKSDLAYVRAVEEDYDSYKTKEKFSKSYPLKKYFYYNDKDNNDAYLVYVKEQEELKASEKQITESFFFDAPMLDANIDPNKKDDDQEETDNGVSLMSILSYVMMGVQAVIILMTIIVVIIGLTIDPLVRVQQLTAYGLIETYRSAKSLLITQIIFTSLPYLLNWGATKLISWICKPDNPQPQPQPESKSAKSNNI